MGLCISFRNIIIENINFKELRISILSTNLFITLISDNYLIVDDAFDMFGIDKGIHQKLSPTFDGKGAEELRRKLGVIEVHGKNARLSVYKSELYGSSIKLIL